MVSNASEDLPEPLNPVITVSELRGIRTLMSFRLCWRAPETVISCSMCDKILRVAKGSPRGHLFLAGFDTGCIKCGKPCHRVARSRIQRIYCRATFRCRSCETNWRQFRSTFEIFQRYANCPRCHRFQLTKLSRRDKLDPMSANPLRRLLGILGHPLYYCTLCRFQFYDWRRLHPFVAARRQENGS